MSEIEVIEKIKEVVSSKIDGFEIKVFQREFTKITEYSAKIGVICKEGLINSDVIKALTDFILDGEYDNIALESTQIEKIDQLTYDIVMLKAQIDIK